MKKKNPPQKKVLPRSLSETQKDFKIVVWDLETSDLNSTMGRIISGVVKQVGKEPKIFVNKRLGIDGLDDKQICIEIRNELETADIICGFYSLGFDLKMLNSRLMYWDETILSKKLHIDLYRVGKRYFNTQRRNLDTISKHLGLASKKTRVDIEYWLKARVNGDKEAINYIVEHNVLDCEVTEQLLLRIRGLIQSISLA